MIFLYLLVFLIIIVLVYYFFLQKLPLKLIAKALNAKIQVQEQSGLFSFSSLYLDAPNLYLAISDSKVYISLLGLFTRKRKLLRINISRLRLQLNKINNKKEKVDQIEINQNDDSQPSTEKKKAINTADNSNLNNFSKNPPYFNHFDIQKQNKDEIANGNKKIVTDDKKIFSRILSMFVFYIFRFLEININKIEFITEINQQGNKKVIQMSGNFDNFKEDFKNNRYESNSDNQTNKISIIIETSVLIQYERTDNSMISIEIGDSSLEINGTKKLGLQKFNFTIMIELIAIYDFLSQAKQIILSKSQFPELTVEINESIVEIKPLIISIHFFPGNCNISFSSIKVSIPYEFPQFIISFKSICLSTQFPLQKYNDYINSTRKHIEIGNDITSQPESDNDDKKKKKKRKSSSKTSSQNSMDFDRHELKKVEATVEDFNVKIVSDHFLHLTKIYFSICDFKKLDFNVTVSSFYFHYSTLDGLKIFPVYKMLRSDRNEPRRYVFAFPLNGRVHIDDFTAKLHLTDQARVEGTSSDVTYSNGAFQFPLVRLRINKNQMAKVRKFSISSPDQTFFTFSADYVVAHDRKKVPIGKFIMNIVYAWRIIKPWASRKKYDEETLPFPIAIHVKKVCAKFHDNPINVKLATLASDVIQPFLQEKIVMQDIFNRKVSDLNFSNNQSNNAIQKLSELYFNTYRKMINKQTFHKYILKMTVTDLDAYLDSRNVAPGMENLLHKFDPTTAELHPNVSWETLEGLKVDIKIGSYIAEMMHLKQPFMEGHKATMKGTVIVAEIQDNHPIEVITNIYNQPHNAPGRATDVKLYCDLSANVDSFEFYFGGPANRLLDDFADTIVACIPQAKLDPSPPLRWWDMLRNIIRGRYVANVNHFIANIVGGTQTYDINNCVSLNAYDARLQITEGNFMLNTNYIDLLRMKKGPIICHFPNFSTDFSINWKTHGGGNPRKHLIIPNVDLFGVEGYDTFHDFRAIEVTYTFVINFTNDKVSPFITMDVAHLSWIIDPILNLFGMNPMNDCYERKVGVDCSRKDNKPEIYYFGSLPCNINVKMSTTPTFSLRIFDHFPVENNENENDDSNKDKKRAINGTSIDVTLQNFTLDCNMKVSKSEFKINCSIFSDSVLFNATDLCIYSKFSKELSTTFMVFTGVIFKYIQEKMSIGVSNIRIIANQFNTKYLKEYLEAFFHFLPDFSIDNESQPSNDENDVKNKVRKEINRIRKSKRATLNSDGDLLTHLLRRRSSQKTVTAQKGRENSIMNNSNNSFFDKFSKPLISLEVPKVEILVESLQYDARLYASLNKVILNISKEEAHDLMLVQLLVDSLSFKKNESFTNKIEIEKFDIISTSLCNLSNLTETPTNKPEENNQNNNQNNNNNNNNNNNDNDKSGAVVNNVTFDDKISLGSLSPNSEKKKRRSRSKSSMKNNDQDLITIDSIRFQYYQNITILLKENHFEASVNSLKLNACSNDIALIKQFAQEVIPATPSKTNDQDINKIINDNQNSSDENNGLNSSIIDVNKSKNSNGINSNERPSYIDVSVLEFDAIIYDSNIVPIGSLIINDVMFKSDKKTDNISENSILVKELGINDIRPEAMNTIVLQRWTAMAEGKTKNPLIRFQCKVPPPVGGITIINHLEINIDPTIVNYEATFFSVLIQFILSKAVKAAPFSQVSYEFPKANLTLPNVLLPQDVLPSMEEDTSKYMEENKSTEIKLMTDQGEDYFLLRYFKITQTKLNVSYHNPESKIPDINEFNGLFHEIKYQDFNCTMNTLIEKLISDISSDVIPQLLKHVIGLGKFQENEEAANNEAASNDQMKQSSKQKMMLFGKKKPK